MKYLLHYRPYGYTGTVPVYCRIFFVNDALVKISAFSTFKYEIQMLATANSLTRSNMMLLLMIDALAIDAFLCLVNHDCVKLVVASRLLRRPPTRRNTTDAKPHISRPPIVNDSFFFAHPNLSDYLYKTTATANHHENGLWRGRRAPTVRASMVLPSPFFHAMFSLMISLFSLPLFSRLMTPFLAS